MSIFFNETIKVKKGVNPTFNNEEILVADNDSACTLNENKDFEQREKRNQELNEEIFKSESAENL